MDLIFSVVEVVQALFRQSRPEDKLTRGQALMILAAIAFGVVAAVVLTVVGLTRLS